MANLPLEKTQETRKLVEKLTGLEVSQGGTLPFIRRMTFNSIQLSTLLSEGKRFEQCCEYAIANLFQISKHLDVNGHKILRMVDGLRDKFYIHAQSHKAERFYSLCQDLLKSSAFKDNGVADVQFSILFLLFELANRPTEAECIFAHEEVDANDSEENKLPSAKLEENFQKLYSYSRARSISPISDLSDWSDDGEDEARVESLVKETTAIDLEKCSVSFDLETRIGGVVTKNGLSGRAWLYQNLEGPSWGQMNSTGGGKMPDWQRVSNISLFREARGASFCISERQIMREALWVLEGRKESRVFEFDDDDCAFVVNPKIRTSHLTQEALTALLLPLANIGSVVQMLKKFVEDVIEVNVPSSAVPPSQTYKAYASSVSNTLCLLNKDVTKLNKLFVEQKSTFTLSMLIENLDAWGRKLSVLGMLHRNGVKSCRPDWSSATRAAHLLNTLYSSASEMDALGEAVSDEMELVLSIFLTAIRPYLDIIDVWITEFSLNDPCQEFIIACNTHAKTLDETFWTDAIILREIPWVKRGSTDTSAVSFLQPVLQMLILIGRSVEVLRHLGALGHIINHDFQPLFSSVVECFDDFPVDETQPFRIENGANPRPYERNLRCSAGIMDNLDSKDVYDSILTGYFKKKYFDAKKKEETALAVDGDAKRSEIDVSARKSEGKSCLRAVLERALLSNVTGKFECVCSSLLHRFNDEYRLKESLFAFRRYFLMQAGDVMFQFTSQMFDTIPARTLANKRAELKLLLEDALSIFSPKDVASLSVDVDKTIAKEFKNAIDAYDSVRLVYEISWPLNIIINNTCKQRYDKAFTFLLKVKYAKYRLDELQFRDLREVATTPSSRERQKKTQRMYVCRVKLLHFVHGLHDYVLTHVLHDTEAACEEIYGSSSSDLERIISANEDYVNTVCERCLLHPKAAVVMESVTKILGLALAFNGLWKNFGSVSWEDVCDVERDLDAGCRRIDSFVQFASLQESLPYLESLVASCCYATTCSG